MLSNTTKQFYETAKMSSRKEKGQYMTPYDVIDSALDIKNNKKINILEPSCGTGQFLDKIKEKYPKAKITGIEIDGELYTILKNKYNDMNIINCDFLEYKFTDTYDMILGNPPYFEFSLSKELKKQYNNVISGRVNIYTLFIKKCIDLLKPKGILTFVIPTSLLTSKYFENIRKYIVLHCNITRIDILNSDNFQDALQQTMIFSLEKLEEGSVNNMMYIVKLGNTTIFNTEYNEINNIVIGKKTIIEYGCSVKTGNIVWNQVKDKLTDNIDNPILIYPRNLVNNKIILSPHENKKQYINMKKPLIKTPLIAINRIIGIKEISLKPVLIESGEYYFENHINVITGSLDKLKVIYNSLLKPDTINFIKNIIGNTQLSKTELETMIPIFE